MCLELTYSHESIEKVKQCYRSRSGRFRYLLTYRANNTPLLSICILSLPNRLESLKKLSDKLIKNGGDFEVIIFGDDKNYTVGEKRNIAKDNASGQYISFIDDDDMVSNDYVKQITNAANEKPDVISFNGIMYRNGGNPYQLSIRKENGGNYNRHHEKVCYRIPNHLCAWRRDMIEHVKYPHKSLGEDNDFASKMLSKIKTEVHIEKNLYQYQFDSETTETQKHKVNI